MGDNRYQMLNATAHGALRVKTARSAELGDAVMQCMVFPAEFRNVQASYPILFQKNPETGAFYALALFGFEEGENLFLDENGWEGSYQPLMMRRQPFLIGLQEQAGEQKKPVISIDMESPRLLEGDDEGEGEALFLDHGGASDFLADMGGLLESVHQGHEQTERLCSLLLEQRLLESFALDVTLDNGEQCQLLGFYAINEERLQSLDAEALGQLQKAGALAPLFMAVASQSQFRPLLARKNASIRL